MDSDSSSSSSSFEDTHGRYTTASHRAHQHKKSVKDFTVSLIRDHKNLAEPRTSQGVFGPNGQLVCFFRSFPRIVRYTQQNALSLLQQQAPSSTSTPPSDSHPSSPGEPETGISDSPLALKKAPMFFESAVMPGEAVKRLMMASQDRIRGSWNGGNNIGWGVSASGIDHSSSKGSDDADKTLRILNNLLSAPSHASTLSPSKLSGISNKAQISQQKDTPLLSPTTERERAAGNYSLLTRGQNTIYLKDLSYIVKAQYALAARYIHYFAFSLSLHTLNGNRVVDVDLKLWCEKNLEIAKECGRVDHARVWNTMMAVVGNPNGYFGVMSGAIEKSLPGRVLGRLYDSILERRDVQLLAMLSVFVLYLHSYSTTSGSQTHTITMPTHFLRNNSHHPSLNSLNSTMSTNTMTSNTSQQTIPTPSSATTSQVSTSPDYFSRRRTISVTTSTYNTSPSLYNPTSPTTLAAPQSLHPLSPLHTPNSSSLGSSKGSWSSLFTSGTTAVGGVVGDAVGKVGNMNLVHKLDRFGGAVGGAAGAVRHFVSGGPGIFEVSQSTQGHLLRAGSGSGSGNGSGMQTPLRTSAPSISNISGLPFTNTTSSGDETSTLRQFLLSTINPSSSSASLAPESGPAPVPVPVPGGTPTSRSRSRKPSLLSPQIQMQTIQSIASGQSRSDPSHTSSIAIATTGTQRTIVSFSPPAASGAGVAALPAGAVTTTRRPTFSQVVIHGGRGEGAKSKKSNKGKSRVFVSEGFNDNDNDTEEETDKSRLFLPTNVPNLIAHILAYAEMLDSWGLIVQRAELMKCLRPEIVERYVKGIGHVFGDAEKNRLELINTCPHRVHIPIHQKHMNEGCQYCLATVGAGLGESKKTFLPRCSICHLFVKGLSHTCLSCTHITHLSCWTIYTRARSSSRHLRGRRSRYDGEAIAVCPAGCGCDCRKVEFEADYNDGFNIKTEAILDV